MTEAQCALVLAALAAVGALVSAVMAVLAKRDSRTSAEAAQTSAAAAEDAVAEARRANDRNDAADRAELNAELLAALSIRHVNGSRFRFANKGGRNVNGLRIVDPPACLVDVDRVFEVPLRGQSDEFGVNVPEDDWPKFVLVQWAGLNHPEPIDFARRPPRAWV